MLIKFLYILIINVIADISFSFKKSEEPYFSNIDELRAIEGAMVINPTRIELTPDTEKSLTFYSGDTISDDKKIRCKIN